MPLELGGFVQRQTLQGRSVLIIEDEPLIALDLVQSFEKAGASVTVESSHQRALDLTAIDGFSAVVMDLSVGKEAGFELCDRLKQRGIAVVIHSGFGRSVADGLGVPHVSKPAPASVLIESVVALLAKRY
jgi:CheY-like chemotaxis protein